MNSSGSIFYWTRKRDRGCWRSLINILRHATINPHFSSDSCKKLCKRGFVFLRWIYLPPFTRELHSIHQWRLPLQRMYSIWLEYTSTSEIHSRYSLSMCSSLQWSCGTVQDIVHLHVKTKEMAEEFETGERREGGGERGRIWHLMVSVGEGGRVQECLCRRGITI